jgi:hypothetical protein
MVEELRGGFALDAHHSTVWVFGIRVEASHPAILNGCNSGAVSGTESTVTTNRVGACGEISHRQSPKGYAKAPPLSSRRRASDCLTAKGIVGYKKNSGICRAGEGTC